MSTHTHPQLDSYRQTLSLQSDSASNATDTPKWYVVTEVRMELYELFVDQIDDEGLSTHVTKAAPQLANGDPTLLAQFIKKNGTHFIRSAVYGGIPISFSLPSFDLQYYLFSDNNISYFIFLNISPTAR